jgi:hypothetical protein
MADAATAKDLDDSFGFGRKMNTLRGRNLAGLSVFVTHQPGQSDAPDPTRGIRKKMPARQQTTVKII